MVWIKYKKSINVKNNNNDLWFFFQLWRLYRWFWLLSQCSYIQLFSPNSKRKVSLFYFASTWGFQWNARCQNHCILVYTLLIWLNYKENRQNWDILFSSLLGQQPLMKCTTWIILLAGICCSLGSSNLGPQTCDILAYLKNLQ